MTIAFAGLARDDYAFDDSFKLLIMKILSVLSLLSFLILMGYAFLLNKKVEFGLQAFAAKVKSVQRVLYQFNCKEPFASKKIYWNVHHELDYLHLCLDHPASYKKDGQSL